MTIEIRQATRYVAPLGRVMVMGFLSPTDLPHLRVPPYQREILPATSVEEWTKAYARGEVPPLDLGCRQDFCEQFGSTIKVPSAYIVDGLQRVTAAEIVVKERRRDFLVPVVVYIGTTYEWESKRFSKLNGHRRQVSRNVLLRNAKDRNTAIRILFDLSQPDAETLLAGRIQWTQRSQVGNLFTAGAALRVSAELHAGHIPGMRDSSIERLSWALHDGILGKENVFTCNVNTFFEILAKIYDFSQLRRSSKIVQLRMGYLLSLTKLLTSYKEFWSDGRLVVSDAVIAEIAALTFDSFQMEDVTNRGRQVDGLVDRMAAAAIRARRKKLTPR